MAIGISDSAWAGGAVGGCLSSVFSVPLPSALNFSMMKNVFLRGLCGMCSLVWIQGRLAWSSASGQGLRKGEQE